MASYLERELQRLRGELQAARNGHPEKLPGIIDTINHRLDKLNDESGAHPPECRCVECHERVYPIMARCYPGGIATVEEFGHSGTEPT